MGSPRLLIVFATENTFCPVMLAIAVTLVFDSITGLYISVILILPVAVPVTYTLLLTLARGSYLSLPAGMSSTLLMTLPLPETV